MTSFLNLWNILKLIVAIFIQVCFIFVLTFKFVFGWCIKNRKISKVSSKENHSDSDLIFSTDYNTLISRLKATKETNFYLKYEQIFRFFEQNSASIEVEYKERIYYLPFIYMPYFRYLPKQNKNEFNDAVDRSSRESKVRSLIFTNQRFINSAKYTFQTDQRVKKIPVLNVMYEYFNSIILLNFFLAVTVNILVMIAYSTTDDNEKQSLIKRANHVGWSMAAFTILILLLLLIQNIPEIKDYASRHDRLKVKIINLAGLCMHSGIFYYTIYLTTILIGIYVHPFAFTFTLSDLVNRFPSMKIIFRAVYVPRKSLILTLLMIILMCYVFALLWYSMMARVLNNAEALYPTSIPGLAESGEQGTFPGTYQDTPADPSDGAPEPNNENDAMYCCTNMFYCFICLIDNLIKNNGKIARVLAGDKNQRAGYPDYYIYIYDNVALIILTILLFEIMAGLIIDTFSALRDLDISKNEDLRGSCFICGLPVEDFEKPGCADFETHITKEHYMWNYICYLSYLTDKEPSDYSGIESYISRQLAISSISWIPNSKTLFLDQETDENIVFDNLEFMENNCIAMHTNLQRMKKIMDNIEQENKEKEKANKKD